MAGKPISAAHPHLASVVTLDFVSELSAQTFAGFENYCIISALPHGESGKAIEKITESFPNARVIDLSGDLRIKDFNVHKHWYKKTPELKELRAEAVYGLPEVNRKAIKTARIVANPGCLATAASLALLPFSESEPRSVHLHLSTGSSGAGKEAKASTHHPIRHANYLGYKLLNHQHEPEIYQTLEAAGWSPFRLPFAAHSLPISRGILCTAFLSFKSDCLQVWAESLIESQYMDHPFVRHKGSEASEIENVVGSNFCDISVTAVGGEVVVHTAIDNLVKGMAGQAIHNMNLMFGVSETSGLWFGGWRPV
jgi:N-acetyl-gamma-glutamyl-phosphate reductase